MARGYWLVKSEEQVYSLGDLEAEGTTSWEGVRNYEARNILRDQMKRGDEVLFYHSNAKPPGVAGIAKVVREGYPDSFAFDESSAYYDSKSDPADPRWFMVDLAFLEAFPRLVTLDEMKATAGLEEMTLVRRARLSVQPVRPEEFRIIRRMGQGASVRGG